MKVLFVIAAIPSMEGRSEDQPPFQSHNELDTRREEEHQVFRRRSHLFAFKKLSD